MQRERRLAPREVGHRAQDHLVAAGGGDARLAPQRERMRACRGHGEALPRELLGEPRPQLPKLGDRLADRDVRVGGQLDRALVRLRAHVGGGARRQLREDVVAALRERPVLRVEQHDLFLEADRVRLGALPRGPAARRAQLVGRRTHVSFAPPFWDELTTRAPASHATRVRPPGVDPMFTPAVNTNGRKSTCRGSSRPSSTTVGCDDSATIGWAMYCAGSARSASHIRKSSSSSACAQTTTPLPPWPKRGLTTYVRRSSMTASRRPGWPSARVGTAATGGSASG